jgi:hypothetical protein
MRVLLWVMLIWSLAPAMVLADEDGEISSTPCRTFSFTLSGDFRGYPGEVFDAVTGDISPWWDHTMSDSPWKLFVEPRVGGGFMEVFNEHGDGVRHAVVTGVETGKFLRYEGPLGLAGHALHMVTTWTFAVSPDQGYTTVFVEVHGAGEVHEGWPEIIERTWRHFLFDRLQPFLAGELE